MARPLRDFVVGHTHHLTTHALGTELCFPDEGTRMWFLQLLSNTFKSKRAYIHAYAMMSNHLHLLATETTKDGLSVLMKSILGRLTQVTNRRLGRRGTLWEDRFSAIKIEDESHLMNSQLYIDANPWRAKLVNHPQDSTWTSYRHNAWGMVGSVLTPHPWFLDLGPTDEARQAHYRQLMEDYLVRQVQILGLTKHWVCPNPLAGMPGRWQTGV